MRTAMRSAADIDDVGWPEPAAVLHRIESTRSCWPSWRANSRSVVAIVSVTAMSLLGTRGAKVPLRGFADLPRSLSSAGKSFDFGDHAVQDLQPRVPETRVSDVHADAFDQLVRPRRSARGQEVQVIVHEGRAPLEKAVVDGERQQVTERVRVDVAGSVQEVADVAPPDLVLLRQGQRIAEHRLQLLLEDLAQLLH